MQPTRQQPARHEERVVDFLAQRPFEPVPLETISQAVGTPKEQLKGVLGSLSKNGGQVQRVGQNAYMWSTAPLPRLGQHFTGEVIGTTFGGASIIRDASGASWKVEPII